MYITQYSRAIPLPNQPRIRGLYWMIVSPGKRRWSRYAAEKATSPETDATRGDSHMSRSAHLAARLGAVKMSMGKSK